MSSVLWHLHNELLSVTSHTIVIIILKGRYNYKRLCVVGRIILKLMFGKYEKLVQLRLCQLLRMKKCHFFFSHHRNDVVFTHSQQKCSLCRRSHRPGTLSLSSPNICPQHPILETLQSAFLPQYKGPTLQFVQRNADFVSFACFKLYISKQQMLIQQTFRPVAANILQTESVLILYVHGVLNYDFTKNFSHATFSNIYV